MSISATGVEAFQLLLDENTTGDVFGTYLSNYLFPAQTHAMVNIWDNLSAHTTPGVLAIIAASPHHYVNRPGYSPDFGPIECPFYKIKAYLRRYFRELTTANLETYIRQAIDTITPANCYNWFRRCGYC
jgi:transposase